MHLFILTGSAEKFHFFIENRVIFDCRFFEALKILSASYSIFNKPFPKTNSVTLDFIQRIVLNIDLSKKGNKAVEPSISSKKVLSFWNSLNKINLMSEQIEQPAAEVNSDYEVATD